jgi:hypothetical protein
MPESWVGSLLAQGIQVKTSSLPEFKVALDDPIRFENDGLLYLNSTGAVF